MPPRRHKAPVPSPTPTPTPPSSLPKKRGSTKKSSSKANAAVADTDEKAKWSTAEDSCLMRVLREQKENGNQSGNGWKKSVWTVCETALAALPDDDKGKGHKSSKKCQDHYENLKKSAKELTALLEKSGFGYDSTRGTVTATPGVWDALLAVQSNKSKFQKWRKATFPVYDDMKFLMHGLIATGAGAFRGGDQHVDDSDEDDRGSDEDVLADVTQFLDGVLGSTKGKKGSDESDSENTSPTVDKTKKKRSAPSSTSSGTASSSTSSGNVAKRRKRSSGVSNPFESLSTSISTMAASFQSTSPQRRQSAIKLMQQDKVFSGEEAVRVMILFTKDTAAADTFCALEDQEDRTSFARAMATTR